MNERANLGTGSQVIFKRNLEALIKRAKLRVAEHEAAFHDL